MENTNQFVLSDYQRAILNEMGISSWQLADKDQSPEKVEKQTLEAVATSTGVISKADALVKLKQLKVQSQPSEDTDSVLVTFAQSDTHFQIFSDVLIALDLDSKSQKYIITDQLSHYSDYPLSWTLGEKVSLDHKQLITPALAELQYSDTKKQLWQQLQSALSHSKI